MDDHSVSLDSWIKSDDLTILKILKSKQINKTKKERVMHQKISMKTVSTNSEIFCSPVLVKIPILKVYNFTGLIINLDHKKNVLAL